MLNIPCISEGKQSKTCLEEIHIQTETLNTQKGYCLSTKIFLIADLTKIKFKSLFEKSEVKLYGKKIKSVLFPEPQFGKAKLIQPGKLFPTSFTFFFNGRNTAIRILQPTQLLYYLIRNFCTSKVHFEKRKRMKSQYHFLEKNKRCLSNMLPFVFFYNHCKRFTQ